ASSGSGAHARPALGSAAVDSTGPLHGTAKLSGSGGYLAKPGGGYSAANHTLIVPARPDRDYSGDSSYQGRSRDRGQRRYHEPILQQWLFSKRILIVLAVIVLGIGIWWLVSGQYSTVPSVAGMTVSTARGDLANAGFVV